MGCSPLFCCFRDKSAICASITGLIFTLIPFVLLIWAIAELVFIKDSGEAMYILAFIVICLILVLFIVLIIISCIRNITCAKIGRVLSVIVLLLCFVAFVFMLIGWIIVLKDYVKIEKDSSGKFWSNAHWAAATLPAFITIIFLWIIAKSANYLYRAFTDIIFSPSNINQNSMTTQPNIPQPGLFPNNNMQTFPVNIQQSQSNLYNK